MPMTRHNHLKNMVGIPIIPIQSKSFFSMDSQIISALTALKNVHNELESIQNELKQIRTRFKPRVTTLKQQQTELQSIIVEYLEAHSEPGIQFQDRLYMLVDPVDSTKKRPAKEDALIALFKKMNVQNPNIALEEVRKIFPIRSPRTPVVPSKTIKVKKAPSS